MNKLPPEILSLICLHLDFRALKAVRSVNKTFNELGSKLVFKDVCFLQSQRSIDKLMNIASHPTLRHHVWLLYYFDELLDTWWLSYGCWEKSADLRGPLMRFWERWGLNLRKTEMSSAYNEQVRHNFSQKALKGYYHHARGIYNDQLTFAQSEFYGPSLPITCSYILSRFPNLCSIYSVRQGDEDGYLPGFARTTGLLHILSRLRKETLQPYPFLRCSIPLGARPLASLIVALSLSETLLGFFEAREIHPCFWLASDPSSCWERVRLHLTTAFRGLITLSLSTLVDDSATFRSNQTLILNSITIFLQSAPLLRRLQLVFKTIGDIERESRHYWTRYLSNVSKLLDNVNFPNLEDFEVASFAVSERSFLKFIERHSLARTFLVDARIVAEPGCGTTHGAWQRIARRLASTHSIRHCGLYGLMDDSLKDMSLADTDEPRAFYRYRVYCRTISAFINHKGQMEFPIFENPRVVIMGEIWGLDSDTSGYHPTDMP